MQSLSRSRSFLLHQCQGRRRGPFITVTSLALVIGVILLAFLVFAEEDKPKSTLRFVSILFRHGDRTPTETYPADPHQGQDVWPDGWGALTKKGKLQMYKLGQYMRSRYGGFLSEIYSPSDVLIKSSDHDRCLMSADTLLAGLFPPKDFQIWNPDLNWQPIPVHATPRLLDKLIVVKKPCPRYDEELSLAYKSPEIQKLNDENTELYKYLSNHTGQAVEDVTGVEFLYNTLEIEDSYKMDLPKWTKEYYPDKMKSLAAQSLAIFTHTPVMKRLKGGPLIAEISQNMYKKDEGILKPDRSFILYSVHDLTIVNVMRALGFTQLLKPDYGAALIFELHATKAGIGHELQVFYMNNTSTKEPLLLHVPECSNPCFLETFRKVTYPVVPTDWEQECLL